MRRTIAAKPRLFLRAAAGLGLAQGLLHLVLFLRAEPVPHSPAAAVVAAMRMPLGSAHATYWGMYFGYGLLAAASTAFAAFVAYLLSGYEPGAERLALRLTLALLLAELAHAGLVSIYFFPLPVMLDAAVATLLGMAAVGLSPTRSEASGEENGR